MLIIASAVFSILLLFHLNPVSIKKSVPQYFTSQNQAVSKVSPGLPVRLVIPTINVYTNIQQVGVTVKGEMEVPSNSVDVGWFDLGPRPGDKGSAVIAGHFDGKNGKLGVFANLNKLKGGDRFYIEDDKGKLITFTVREIRIYNPGYADEVFSANDGIHLNLITCDGVWDGVKKSYTKRLVVFADIEN